MKVLETTYRGIRFRSRLEARWAVFFDELGLKWEYEKEGYDLGRSGRYLPDFFFPDQSRCRTMFVEIKPQLPVDEETGRSKWPHEVDGWKESFKKLTALGEQSGLCCVHTVMLCGTPGPVEIYERNSYEGFVPADDGYLWCQCPECGALGVQYEGRSARNYHSKKCSIGKSKVDRVHNVNSPELLWAYAVARSARFDDGELRRYD